MFVLALIPLSLILRKAKTAYKFSGSEEKINYLLFMDDLKLYRRNEKELEDLGKEFVIEKSATLVLKKEKILKSVGIGVARW